MKRLIPIIVILAGQAAALAQSFNVDVNVPGGSFGAGAPANAFGGAADVPGFWNSLDSSPGLSYTLKGLNGVNTTASIQTAGTGISVSANEANSSGEFAKLMEDGWQAAGANDSFTYTFNGLSAGPYFVYTYADDPTSTSQESRVTINGASQNVGGSHSSNLFINNVTHARHFVQLAAGNSIAITIANNTNVGGARAVILGFQVEKLPSRLFVKSNAPAGGNGESWATAFSRVQDAFAAAPNYGGAISEIWVAAGTYVPADISFRGDTFDMPNGVAVYGGFNGSETNLDQRNIDANPVFLSGSIGAAGIADNSYHILTAWGCNYATVLDGFTLSSGNANGTLGWDMHGAAMYIRESQMTIRNCKFVGNAGWRGGAVAIQDATPRFENCFFFNNTAEQMGGAMYTLPGGSAYVVDCQFRLNHATVNYGGAISHYDGANLWVFNSRFQKNDAGWGGGAIFSSTGNTTVGNCIFTDNTGDADRGGAIHTFGPDIYLFVYNSTFWKNHAYQCGGVDAFNGSLVYLRNSIFFENTDDDPATNAEGAQIRKESGGAATLSVTRCNVQNWSGVLGGTGNFGADPMFADADGPDNSPGTLDDNLRLAFGSPCIDRGGNSALPSDSADVDDDNNVIEPLPIDLDGNPRRMDDLATADNGDGTAPIVDMGAYEFLPCQPCDTNCDGSTNLFDIQGFVDAVQSGGAGGCSPCSADANNDGSVNLFDIQSFVDCLSG